MAAALEASDETISLLLSLGANPDKTDDGGKTALIAAIQSKCSTTINMLTPVTRVNLGGALRCLARDKVEVTTGQISQVVERAAQDEEAANIGLLGATRFGSSEIVKIFAENMLDHSILEANREKLWIEAVKSDSEATVSALLDILPEPTSEAVFVAKKRGVPGVVKLLLPDTKADGEKKREALRDSVLAKTAQLLDEIPRDVEFTYNQKIDKLRPLSGKDPLVPYTTLLKHLHLPKAHFDDKEPMVCPSDCSQKQSCQRIRETLGLVHLVARNLGEKSEIFEGLEVSMIGSTRAEVSE